MQTENQVLDISAHKQDEVVTLDFRTAPNMVPGDKPGTYKFLNKTGYASIHFQLSPADAVKLGKSLIKEGRK